MYTSPISRGITGRNGSPSTPKAVVDACKLAAVGWAKSASDPHYRVEVSDQQSTPGTKAPSNLSSNFLWGSCAISSTTTFAHHKDGSSVGSMQFTSVRLLKFPDEALTSTNNGVQGGMHSLLSLISEHSKEQKWSPTASRSKPSADPPANPQVSPLSESVFANIPDEFVLLEAGGQQRSLAEFLGDAALMGADPSVGEQTRMEAKARGGRGQSDFMDFEQIAATGTAFMLTFRSGNRIYAVLGAVIDRHGKLLIGMSKAAKDTNFCDVGSIRKMLRKAAYPLPMGDCDESLINLQYFAGAVENGQPKSFTMQLSPRVVKDIKKQPTARGPTVRMRRDKQGSMPELPGTDSPCVVDTSRHQDLVPAPFLHPLSLCDEPGHLLRSFSQHDKLASSARMDVVVVKEPPVTGGAKPDAMMASRRAAYPSPHDSMPSHTDKGGALSPLPKSVRQGVPNRSSTLSDAQGRKKPSRFLDAESERERSIQIANEHWEDENRRSRTKKASPRCRDESKSAASTVRLSSDIARSANDGPRQAPTSEARALRGKSQGVKAQNLRLGVKDVESKLAPTANDKRLSQTTSSQRLSGDQRGTQASSDFKASKGYPSKAGAGKKSGPQL